MKTITTLILCVIAFCSYAQPDTAALRFFFDKQQPYEKAFITQLKGDDYDKCRSILPPQLLKTYGKFVLLELQYLNGLFKQYPEPEVEHSIGTGPNGVGAFGHDTPGQMEISARYTFIDKDKNPIYWFTLYYSNADPGTIQHIKTKRSAKAELEAMSN